MSWCLSTGASRGLSVSSRWKPLAETFNGLARGCFSIWQRQYFRRDKSIVADVPQRLRHRGGVEMTEADGTTIGVREVHVADFMADEAQSGRDIALLDI